MKHYLFTLVLILLTVTTVFAERSGGRISVLPKGGQLDIIPPGIVITSPDVKQGVKVVSSEAKMTMIGRATDPSGVASVTVNGNSAKLDESGNFSIELLLKPGKNLMSVVSVDTRGNQGVQQFILYRQADAVQTTSALKAGTYHALVIGVQSYYDSAITSLDAPLQDAQGVYDILTANYSFLPENVIFLKNPERTAIIQAFDQLAQKVVESDSVLIFYAGHGYWDERLKQGFWLPANATRKSRAEWLSNGTIRDYINGIKSRHTLLVADACFSGGIFKTRKAFDDAPRAIQELVRLPSRKAMTSGALKEVPDRSVFVDFFLKRLKQNQEPYLSSEQLFASLRQAVISNSSNNQIPQFGEIRETGDEGGDFVFERKH
jgi:hypothetical protein